MRVVYLGPDGSFSSRAARALFAAAEHKPVDHLDAVVSAVVAGTAGGGVLPLLNRRAGAVPGSLAKLAAPSGVGVRQLMWLPIDLCLLGLPGAALEDITVVRSHPMALKQAPSLTVGRRCEAAGSTAAAAASVLADGVPRVAALADRAIAGSLGLRVLAEAAPEEENATLFAALTPQRPAAKGDKGLFIGPSSAAPTTTLVVDEDLALWSGQAVEGAVRLGPPWEG